MARVTDDERRVVEGRLRELAERKVPCDIDCYIAEAVMGHDFCETPCDGCLSTVLTLLADLIEPSYNRNVLLALADKIVADTEEDVLSEDLVSAWQAGEALRDVASKIREACGVVG